MLLMLIAGEVYVQALPAARTVAEGEWKDAAMWLAPLLLLCLAFLLTAAWEAWDALRRVKSNSNAFWVSPVEAGSGHSPTLPDAPVAPPGVLY
jgi:hypothetical protein